jgi:hypothetical protein
MHHFSPWHSSSKLDSALLTCRNGLLSCVPKPEQDKLCNIREYYSNYQLQPTESFEDALHPTQNAPTRAHDNWDVGTGL